MNEEFSSELKNNLAQCITDLYKSEGIETYGLEISDIHKDEMKSTLGFICGRIYFTYENSKNELRRNYINASFNFTDNNWIEDFTSES